MQQARSSPGLALRFPPRLPRRGTVTGGRHLVLVATAGFKQEQQLHSIAKRVAPIAAMAVAQTLLVPQAALASVDSVLQAQASPGLTTWIFLIAASLAFSATGSRVTAPSGRC